MRTTGQISPRAGRGREEWNGPRKASQRKEWALVVVSHGLVVWAKGWEISGQKEGIMMAEWRMENGEWRMENGEWRMENGEWRMAKNGFKLIRSNSWPTLGGEREEREEKRGKRRRANGKSSS